MDNINVGRVRVGGRVLNAYTTGNEQFRREEAERKDRESIRKAAIDLKNKRKSWYEKNARR